MQFISNGDKPLLKHLEEGVEGFGGEDGIKEIAALNYLIK